MISTSKRFLAGLALTLLTLGAAPTVLADQSYYVNQGLDYYGRDLDFTTSSIPTNSSGVTSGLKMWTIQLATNNGQAQCLELRTTGDGTGDTRFWADGDSGDFVSLNDDSNGGLYSMARVWMSPPSNGYEYAFVYVTGYSSYYNSMQFTLNIWKYDGLTEAQCTSGATLKHINGVQTLVNAS